VPFRLLGVVADPHQAANLTGHAFARYAASGTDVTLVCAGGRAWPGTEQLSAVRRLGVRDLVLLDYDVRELTAAALEDVFADLMAGVRPHVVVADDTQPAIRDAAASAFSRVRRRAGGSSALPAKLYYRLSGSSPLVTVTTAIAIPGESPELFVRAFPNPWVTGVLERDLFAGVPPETRAPSGLEQQLAG
jgi:LmbE family N-acetylglucosaminyl deacetylase